MNVPRRSVYLALVLASAAPLFAQFPYQFSEPAAQEAFRTGVEAYNSGRYAESLLLFEQALGSSPDDPLSSFWLGKAYWRLGAATTAFELWRDAMESGGPSPFLQARLELAEGLIDPNAGQAGDSYVRYAELAGVAGSERRFLRPSWVEPLPDGSLLLVAHGTNEVLKVSANGQIVATYTGGSSGFDRPYALALLPDGDMVLSEFQADRLVRLGVNGSVRSYHEQPQRKLAGPQYLVLDHDGFLYVSDVGMSRVVKYSPEGKPVLAFGGKSAVFAGLSIPTGVAVIGDTVYVADAARRGIYAFDSYGNYLGSVAEGRLVRPEGMRAHEGSLLVADSVRVVLVDPETEGLRELFRADRADARLVSAAFDANGELVIADFDASELVYLSDPAERYTGLSLELLRVDASSFPSVSLDVRVLDRRGRAVGGLGLGNFYVSELVETIERRLEAGQAVDYKLQRINTVDDLSFLGSLDADQRIDAVFLVEGSPAMAQARTEARDRLTELHGALGGDASSVLLLAGNQAQPPVGGGLRDMSAALLAMKPSQSWRFDSGVRLAAGSLFDATGRKAVFYLTTGSVNEQFLDGPAAAELAAVLRNNGIAFYAVVLGSDPAAPLLGYLADATGGQVARADRPEGLAGLAADLRSRNTGWYRLSFMSGAPDGFGLDYLRVNVEVYLRGRSGKDEGGYFAPLR